jgi:hypothetical protein
MKLITYNTFLDDCWIWGERIVQLNLLSPTYLTFSPYTGKISIIKFYSALFKKLFLQSGSTLNS